MVSFYRKSTIAKPLHSLTDRERKFVWTIDCEKAFTTLKSALLSDPILAYPTPDDYFILDTDASSFGMGAVLNQVQNGEEKVIAYFSKCFSRSVRNYCVTRKKLLAVVTAVKHFHHYLYGRKFTIRTDHGSLRWLTNFKQLEGQLCRWVTILENYDYEIVHRPSRVHGNADALTRRPCYDSKCTHCDKIDNKHVLRSCQLDNNHTNKVNNFTLSQTNSACDNAQNK